jgi:hypothetical protein
MLPKKNESPEVFLDRLRKLCQRTVRSSERAEEQAVINQEAQRRLLAAFINVLNGAPGKQVRLQMPKTIDKALNMAMIATNAEKEEKASVRDDRGTSAKVFAVGGSCEGSESSRYSKHRGKVQWSGNRGAGFQPKARQTQYSGRVDGTYSDRPGSRTPMATEYYARIMGGGTASGPKSDDDRYAPSRPHGIQCYNCGLLGHVLSNCQRGQRKNLKGIGRTKAKPLSGLK